MLQTDENDKVVCTTHIYLPTCKNTLSKLKAVGYGGFIYLLFRKKTVPTSASPVT